MEIVLDELDFAYGDGNPVLRNISLTVDEPGLICIIGPNGVGKSTLIKCINKILKPNSGNVLLDSIDINEISLKELSKVMAYVPVASEDSFSMTVFDTVMMGRYPHQKLHTGNLDMKIVKRALRMMGIDQLAMRNFNELSAGQHQKVAIARGLAQTPKILILDEPTSNLDVKHQIQVMKLLRNLASENGMTVFMISHDLNITSKYADKIIMMASPGIIYKVGTPAEVLTPDVIYDVYGVDCQVVEFEGRPHIMMSDAISEK